MAGVPKGIKSQPPARRFSVGDVIMALSLLLAVILAVGGAVAAWAAIDQRLDVLELDQDRLIKCIIEDYARCRRAEEAAQ